MILSIVNEESTSYLTVDFKDKADALEAPASVSYRIDCLTSGQEIQGDTSITPLASVEIEIDPALNAIQDANNAREWRRVTVTATYGPNDQINDQFDFYLRNMSGI